jgi:single-strand DNA-binding protein
MGTNTWHGIGNLTADPEVRYTESGKAVTNFSIAINNGRSRDGEELPPTYIDVVAWEKLAELVGEYLRKGKKVFVSGPIQIDKYEKDGQTIRRWKIRARDVEFLSPRSEESKPERDEEPMPWER